MARRGAGVGHHWRGPARHRDRLRVRKARPYSGYENFDFEIPVVVVFLTATPA